jgi:hypothetical protein
MQGSWDLYPDNFRDQRIEEQGLKIPVTSSKIYTFIEHIWKNG